MHYKTSILRNMFETITFRIRFNDQKNASHAIMCLSTVERVEMERSRQGLIYILELGYTFLYELIPSKWVVESVN